MKDICWILEELNKEIPQISTKGLTDSKLKASSKKGFCINRGMDGDEISFYKGTDLCRALLQYVSGAKELSQACSFDEFGVMLDISRNAVIGLDSLKKMIRLAALMGYNFIGLYMEDTMEVPGEPYLGYMRGRLSASEIREADEYAAGFDLELRPYIQTLAHVNQITRYERYQKIIDTDDILLVGDERTKELIRNILAAVSANFKSRKVNIGMDEAHMLGLGKYLDKHGYEDREEILRKHLDMVMDICKELELEPQMWSDMFFRLACHGEYYKASESEVQDLDIPKGLSLGYWDYYSTDEAHYDKQIKLHKKMTDNIAFAGGAWKWTGFTPHNRYSIEAGRAALYACQKNQISSVVITCWGDDGAETDAFAVLPALFEDAETAYDAYDAYGTYAEYVSFALQKKEISKKCFQLLTGYSLDDFLQIDAVNPYSDEKKHNNCGKYLLYNDPLIGTFDSVVTDDLTNKYIDLSKKLLRLSKTGKFGYLFETQAALSRVLSCKADYGIRVRMAYLSNNTGSLKKLAIEGLEIADDIDSFYLIFQKQWMHTNKSNGFEVQTLRIGGLIQRMKDTAGILEDYADGRIQKINELDEKQLSFAYFDENEISKLNYNLWTDIATPSRI